MPDAQPPAPAPTAVPQQQPAPAAAPAAAAVQQPAPGNPAAAPQQRGLTQAEETQLAQLTAKAASARGGPDGMVSMKITSGHESVTYGGLTVSRDWTPVPASMVARLISEAANSGVDLARQDEEGN